MDEQPVIGSGDPERELRAGDAEREIRAGGAEPEIRASDAERERSIMVLRDAVVEGRLTLEEFGDRVGQAQVARTDHQLAVLTNDLPVQPVEVARLPDVARHRAVLSQLVRRGLWDLPQHSSYRSIFGTIDLDLRKARLEALESELEI